MFIYCILLDSLVSAVAFSIWFRLKICLEFRSGLFFLGLFMNIEFFFLCSGVHKVSVKLTLLHSLISSLAISIWFRNRIYLGFRSILFFAGLLWPLTVSFLCFGIHVISIVSVLFDSLVSLLTVGIRFGDMIRLDFWSNLFILDFSRLFNLSILCLTLSEVSTELILLIALISSLTVSIWLG